MKRTVGKHSLSKISTLYNDGECGLTSYTPPAMAV